MVLKLLIDSNVVLDMFLEREKFFSMSTKAITLSRRYQNVKNFISASMVTDIYYIAYKNIKSHQIVREKFEKLFSFVEVVAVTPEDIQKAFALNWTDFEDSVQYAVAARNDFDGIITRNMKGFDDSEVKIFTPEEICQYVEEKLKE